MGRRAVGLETEFGLLVKDESLGRPEEVAEVVKDHAFSGRRLGLIDLHARDYAFEPARAGGFLVNGGRLYVDAVGDHLEYATPECISWRELAAHDKAGQRIVVSLLEDLEMERQAAFYNNNIDHYGGHTFGCHENYAVKLEFHFFSRAMEALLPFLVTRQIFAGAGRVGGHRINPRVMPQDFSSRGYYDTDYLWTDALYGVEDDTSVRFQLSQRADHIVKPVSTRVRFNRAIVNPKREAMGTGAEYDRLHLLFGESNCSEFAGWLKVATTAMVLDLIEASLPPARARLREPVRALRSISRDASWRWIVELADGTTMPAVDVQRLYLAAARRYLAGRDEETEAALAAWEEMLDGLEADPLRLADRLDWAAKYKLLYEFSEGEDAAAQKPAGGRKRRTEIFPKADEKLHSLDMEYHNIDPAQGLYYGLEEGGEMRRLLSEGEIESAMTEPPADTRAKGRAEAVRRLLERGSRAYAVDWDFVWLGKDISLSLPDPHETYVEEVRSFLG